jgi:hypothetical protein
MDIGKDMQRGSAVAKFIANQTTRTSPFGDNVSAERAYRRVEKIVAAVHLLTNHISDTEHLRIEARRTATALLAQVLALRDELRSPTAAPVREVETTIRYLISLLRMLVVSGHVSSPNADIVSEALDDLGVFVQAAHRSVLSESVRLSRDEFVDVRMRVSPHVQMSDIEKVEEKTKEHTKEHNRVAATALGTAPIGSVQMSVSASIPDTAPEEEDTPRVVADIRVASILEVLRAGGSWGIKDILAHLPEYSEKMIQRELAELVQKRVVDKQGAKRWSKYSLIRSS